jgi:hypothetical protein
MVLTQVPSCTAHKLRHHTATQFWLAFQTTVQAHALTCKIVYTASRNQNRGKERERIQYSVDYIGCERTFHGEKRKRIFIKVEKIIHFISVRKHIAVPQSASTRERTILVERPYRLPQRAARRPSSERLARNFSVGHASTTLNTHTEMTVNGAVCWQMG